MAMPTVAGGWLLSAEHVCVVDHHPTPGDIEPDESIIEPVANPSLSPSPSPNPNPNPNPYPNPNPNPNPNQVGSVRDCTMPRRGALAQHHDAHWDGVFVSRPTNRLRTGPAEWAPPGVRGVSEVVSF